MYYGNSFNCGRIRTGRAVLVAISIPIFTSQLEKSREATDLANIRSAYAECSAALLTESTTSTNGVTYTAPTTGENAEPGQATKDVKLTQKQADWQTDKATEIGGTALSALGYTPAVGDTVTVTVKADGTWTLAKRALNKKNK